MLLRRLAALALLALTACTVPASIDMAPAHRVLGYYPPQTVKAVFNGTQDYIDVSLSAAYANDNLQAGVLSSDVPVTVTLTNRTHYAVRVEPSARFTGTVVVSQTGDAPLVSATETASGIPTTQTTTLGNSVYERAFYLPTDAASRAFYIANRVPPTYVNQAVPGTNIAFCTSDGAGGVTSCPDVYSNQTIPLPSVAGTGILEYLGPLTITAPPGVDGKIVTRVSIPSGTPTVSICDVEHHGIYYTGTQSVTAPGTSAGAALLSPYVILIKYNSARRRILVLGDSISVGATLSAVATTGYEDAAWYQLGMANNWAVNLQGRPGATLDELANPVYGPPPGGTAPAGGREWDTLDVGGADVVIQRGTNDVSFGLAAMQADLAVIITHLQSVGARRIYANNIAPALAWTAYDATRVSYNAWLLANWASIGLYRAPTDLDLALRDPANHAQLLGSLTTDGTHMTPAGQTAIKNAWQLVL